MKTNDKDSTKKVSPFFAKLLEKQITNTGNIKGGADGNGGGKDDPEGPGKGVDQGDANGNPVTMKAPSDHDEGLFHFFPGGGNE